MAGVLGWMRRCVLVGACVFAMPGWLQAVGLDEAELSQSYGSYDYVSIATGVTQPLAKAPAVATVITADDIQRMGATSFDQVLETVPGLHVSLSSVRFSPIYSIRGIHTDKNPQVLMLVNGTPITQAYFGDRGVHSSFPLESIERIEVIRGPGSAVYGADAFSGVINVITRNGESFNGKALGARVGSFDTGEAWGLYGERINGMDVFLSVQAMRTSGDDDRGTDTDAQSVFDQFFATNASLAPGSFNTEAKRLDTRLEIGKGSWYARFWNWRQMDMGVGPGLAQALDPTGHSDVDNYLVELGIKERQLTRNWSAEGRISYMDINTESRQTLFPAGTVLPIGTDGNINPVAPAGLVLFSDGLIGNPEIYEKHWRADAVAFYRGMREHTWRFGTGFYYTELTPKETKNFGPGVIDGTVTPIDGTLTSVTGTSDVFIRAEDRTVQYLSVQDQWDFAQDWDLTVGVRYDHYSDFGSTVNPRAALVWNTRRDLTTKFLYGRAFRAPSFAELFAINNPIVLGNPNLDPETINTYELAFDYQPSFDTRIGASLFRYKVRDLIKFVPDPSGTTTTAANTAGQDGHGIELEFDTKFNRATDLRAYYAYQKSTDRATDAETANAPQQQAYTQLRWRPVELWELSTKLTWIGDRPREQGDPRDEIDDYTFVDLAVTRNSIQRNWSVQLAVHNIFDHDACEPSPVELTAPAGSLIPNDYQLPGRAVSLTGRLNF